MDFTFFIAFNANVAWQILLFMVNWSKKECFVMNQDNTNSCRGLIFNAKYDKHLRLYSFVQCCSRLVSFCSLSNPPPPPPVSWSRNRTSHFHPILMQNVCFLCFCLFIGQHSTRCLVQKLPSKKFRHSSIRRIVSEHCVKSKFSLVSGTKM